MKSNTDKIDLFPGSKDWIQKYFHSIESQQINLHKQLKCSEQSHDLHLLFVQHGILFGSYHYPLLFQNVNDSKWTKDEKVKFLLFESLLYVYLCKNPDFKSEHFVKELLTFFSLYKDDDESALSFLYLDFLQSKSPFSTLEKILSQAIEIKSSFISTNKWLNYIENSFVFLDVILFEHYLNTSKNIFPEDLKNLKRNTLLAVIHASHADNVVSKEEENVFQTFLTASSLSSSDKKIVKEKFRSGIEYSDYKTLYFSSTLFRYFLLDIALLTIFGKSQASVEEENFLESFANFLYIEDEQLLIAKVTVQQFVMNKSDNISVLNSDSNYEKMLSGLSNRWLKIISRNKDKFSAELSESKEFMTLIKKAAKTELSPEEKKKVSEQFKDIFLKSMPSLAIFMLPGGALLLPLLLKIIPSLLPSSFRDNEI
ncbi:MAG TPA: LETM1-related biofilm-associated protein [Crocinitomicaceae bacterium]|nr:LETM1-related biofilm-associated protein [Crocinitomicaceae bacterium]